MPPVHIVTDSTVQFPTPGFLESHPVTVVPMKVRGVDASLLGSEELDLDSARHLFEDAHSAPILDTPSVEELAKVYRAIHRHTKTIVSIHGSSAVSNIIENAKAASQDLLGRCDIQVIDSEMISIGLGLLVEAAARAAVRGKKLDEIVRIVRGMIPRLYIIFCLEDLMYLERFGLVSLSQAILGNMLGVIPFLTLEQGRLAPMEKVRSRQRAVEKLIEFVSEFTMLDHLALLHDQPHATSQIRGIAERLREIHPNTPLFVGNYNIPLATFLGLNSLGLVVLETEETY
jgi:DegV family protein with EDD domain